jgi:hypothetical protein
MGYENDNNSDNNAHDDIDGLLYAEALTVLLRTSIQENNRVATCIH